MANSYFGIAGGASAFPATQTVQLEKQFRKRFRDQSIMSLLTNRQWQGRFRGVGTEIKIPVLPVLHTYKTVPGQTVKYQTPKGGEETFVINRERACGLHFLEEDVQFADLNVVSPIIDEQSKVMGEDVEFEFLSDIAPKCAAANTGAAATGKAGYRTGGYAIGSSTLPTSLFKSDAAAASGSAHVTSANKLAAPEFFAAMAATLTEQPGGKQGAWRCVIPTCVAYLLQTSELKQAELTGDAVSTLRKSVKDIGNLAGMDLIMSDKVPYSEVTGASGSAVKVFPIYALDTTAITFAEEVVIKEKLQDKDEWGDFHRSKMIYDWFVRYPERFAVGYVTVG